MTLSIIHRYELTNDDIVCYVNSTYNFSDFDSISWNNHNTMKLIDIDYSNLIIIFGCLRNGVFHYVKDTSMAYISFKDAS